MDYKLTMDNINSLAQEAGQLYTGLNKKIEANHETFIDPIAQDKQDTMEYARKIAALHDQAQQILNNAVTEKKQDINDRYHSNVTADQLAEVNQLRQYDLSEDELNGYLDKYKVNPPLLNAFTAAIKEKGWTIDGLTYDNEMSMLKYFQTQMQTVVDGIASGSKSGLPVAANIASRLVASRIADWQNKVANQPYSLRPVNN